MANDAVWVLCLLLALSQSLLSSAGAQSGIRLPSQLGRDSPASCPAPDPDLYYQPVIGIVSHPGDGASGRLSNASGASYIAASYVKFVEAAGARVVPLVYTDPPEKLLKKLELYGISPGKLLDNQKLSSFFEILTTCTDEDDKVYVSTVRSRNYPVTGFQWHPEKNAFEWGSPKIPHTEDAIQTTQYVANYLVSEARKSLNRPVAQELLDNLIYNYSPTYGGKAGRGYDEVYIFAQA